MKKTLLHMPLEPYKALRLCNRRGVAKISIEDYSRVSKISWALSGGRYAVASFDKGKKRVYLHRFILGVSNPRIQVDHINNDGLDCRRSNLRKCSNAENQMNRRPTSSSGFKGVSRFYRNKKNPWMASIMVDKVQIHLGYFKTKVLAAKAYDRAAIRLFGEFAKLNFT